jgi:hypothetical protein
MFLGNPPFLAGFFIGVRTPHHAFRLRKCRNDGNVPSVPEFLSEDLSEWVMITKVNNADYPYLSHKKTGMNDVSLWRDIQQNGLAAGIHKQDWIGMRIDEEIYNTNKLEKIKLAVNVVGQPNPYKFTFVELNKSEVTIRDIVF